ncbi:hypothetical protein P691DRAFT_780653 [Macrolepiota fuliginosa MF-IS2]|uniref:Uncharacterized protein n=1 Tax=Macrolepiota fuliginosa MF-IS2 TaxID=1400762 RepID=A0A9P5X1A7_9AGAR|nr:hypothetical protein P691DRAFT_780653 [Macrolepiota fuliginosa MF-IS2]
MSTGVGRMGGSYLGVASAAPHELLVTGLQMRASANGTVYHWAATYFSVVTPMPASLTLKCSSVGFHPLDENLCVVEEQVVANELRGASALFLRGVLYKAPMHNIVRGDNGALKLGANFSAWERLSGPRLEEWDIHDLNKRLRCWDADVCSKEPTGKHGLDDVKVQGRRDVGCGTHDATRVLAILTIEGREVSLGMEDASMKN